jgi:hypothetical protein
MLAVLTALSVSLAGPSAAEQRSEPSMTARAEAKARFTRGKQLVEEKDLPAALVEFQRAYTLVPSPITQLNIAFVYVQMRRPVEAADALDAALGSPDLPAAYAATARATLADQQARIGRIEVTTSLPATLELDGVEIGRTPLAEPLRVGEGLHTLAAMAAGCPPIRREVRAVGGGVERVSIVLTPAVGMGSLTVTTNVSDADARSCFVAWAIERRAARSTSRPAAPAPSPLSWTRTPTPPPPRGELWCWPPASQP